MRCSSALLLASPFVKSNSKFASLQQQGPYKGHQRPECDAQGNVANHAATTARLTARARTFMYMIAFGTAICLWKLVHAQVEGAFILR